MNTYTSDGQFIIDATNQRWAVNAWHAAGPLSGTPAGVYALDENGNWSGEIAFKATDENRTGWWLARPPLPELPQPPKSPTPTDLNDPKELRMNENTNPAEKPFTHLNDFVEMWQKELSDQAAKITDLELKLVAEREDNAVMRKYLSIPDGARLNPDYAAMGPTNDDTFNPLWKLRCDVEQLQSALAVMTKKRDELKADSDARKAADEYERGPKFKPIPKYGDHLPLSKLHGWYSGGDGLCYYATATEYASGLHCPMQKHPEWATHFIYFSK